jgi:hypothetical protein
MRGIFKSELAENMDLMKQLGLIVSVLLLFGVGIASAFVMAGLTADQQVQPPVAAVGETAMVMVMLSYSGSDITQVTVTPGFTPGIIADSGAQMADLGPGGQQIISYPIRAEDSGSYWIASLISYTDDGVVRQLSKESPFTATGKPGGQQAQPWSGPVAIQPASMVLQIPGGNESVAPDALSPADMIMQPANGSIQFAGLPS